MPLPLANSYWVLQPGLLAGEHPCGSSDADTRERVAALLAAGVDGFLDLTRPGECASYLGYLPTAIEYDNRPLIDHGIPQVPEQMQDILAVIGDALRRGRTLYLHCRAGVGRTGTVVGCLLASRGMGGEAALEELNLLWQQCQRSHNWLLVPETPEQREYILNWLANSPPTLAAEPEAVAAVAGLRERFQGALLGLAVGDALAVATQMRAAGSFAPVTDMLGGGVFDLPRGAWTDETAMALCLADSLLCCGAFDARDQVARYVRWQTEGYLSATGQCVGITAGVTRALGAARFRRQVFAGSHDPLQTEKDPLTRVAPNVMFHFASARQAVTQAREAARTTCQAPAVLAATGYFAACLHAAFSAAPRPQLTSPPPALWAARTSQPRLAALAAGNFSARAALAEGAAPDAIDVLRAALAAFAATGNFRDGALAAVNLGGESDAIGAVYGQLAGAHYGVQGIPAAWRAALLRRELLEDYADRLLAQARVALAT